MDCPAPLTRRSTSHALNSRIAGPSHSMRKPLANASNWRLIDLGGIGRDGMGAAVSRGRPRGAHSKRARTPKTTQTLSFLPPPAWTSRPQATALIRAPHLFSR
jgi:hypothetical protein